jgi:hypothetical protein
MTEGSESESVLMTDEFVCGSGRHKNIGTDPTDPDADSEHLYIYIILQSHKKITKQYPEIKVFLSYYIFLLNDGRTRNRTCD